MTTKNTILKKIRSKCLECCCEQAAEVRKCHITDCSLHPFRFGTDPHPSEARNKPKITLPEEASSL